MTKVGDFIILPAQEWHMNHAAQAMYAQAQAITAAHRDEKTLAPQFEVAYEDKFKSRLVRTR